MANRIPKHVNPYNRALAEEKEKHDLFETAWNRKTTFGNFKGMWKSGREERQRRVQARVEAFVTNRDRFVASHELSLQPHYNSELGVNHFYPGTTDPVKYLDRNVPTERRAYAIDFSDGKVTQGGIKDQKGNLIPVANVGHKAMITRRHSNAGQILAMIKSSTPERTQHSTFNSGEDVANAGFVHFGADERVEKFELSSGHYAPTDESGVKLAMWAEANGAFGKGKAKIVDRFGRNVDTSQETRMFTVQKWAQKNPA